MNSSPKVTVLVPSYNHGRFLRQRLESIAGQTYSNIELIVIDDCSQDDAAEVIQSFAKDHVLHYIRNAQNSGTPFSAWEQAVKLAAGEYIWICEDDDYADLNFLETAVGRMLKKPKAALFYCDSWIVNEEGGKIDHSDTYFHQTWMESRWDSGFCRSGISELKNYQMRGQTVPNMSSALISAKAFRNAYSPVLKKFRLTGDWLFIGWVMRYGQVIYCKQTLNYFRKHDNTSRVLTPSARSQAEYILTKYLLFSETGRPAREFSHIIRTDAVRFIHESAGLGELLKALFKISVPATLRCALVLMVSLGSNRKYLKKFFSRWRRYR